MGTTSTDGVYNYRYLPQMISEMYRARPEYSAKCIEKRFMAAIESFVREATTLTPEPKNLQLNIVSRSGTILLPLIVQSETFHSGTQDWAAGMELGRSLFPLIKSAEEWFKAYHDTTYRYSKANNAALRKLAANRGKEIDLPGGCFHSMRLSINVAKTPVLPSCGHASPWCVVVVLGDFLWGDMRFARPGYTVDPCRGRSGDLVILEDNISVGCTRFLGQRYQLEFFLAPESPR